MGTMDFIIIGGILIFGLIGLWRGGAKIFFGFFMLLIIMVGSAFISSLLTPVFLQKQTDEGIQYSSIAHLIMDPIGNALPSGEEVATVLDSPIVLGEDGILYVGDPAEIPMKTAVSENIPVVGPVLASFLEKAAIPGTTLRNAISYNIARLIYEVIVWVILVVILAIIRNILRKKIFRWLDDKSHATMSKIDRAIGVAVNLVIFLAILWGVGAMIAHFDDGSNWAHMADTFLLNGKLSGPLMKANPFLKIINVVLPVGESL